jgi:uncharacterized delta-60 repeat protein
MKTEIKNYTKGLFLLGMLTMPGIVVAQDGALDLSFDNDGFVTTTIGADNDVVNSIAIQSDGKMVVAGYSSNGPFEDFTILRYNTDGSLDQSFGTDGIVITNIVPYQEAATSVALQNDGKIVAVGYISIADSFDFVVVRYNTDGSLDTTFDNDGIVTTSIGVGNDLAVSMIIQDDGKIVSAGESSNGDNDDIALIRYNTDGSLDTSFGDDGIVTTDIDNTDNVGVSIALQSEGKIVVAGVITQPTGYDTVLLQYNSDGSLDNSFGSNGMTLTGVENSDEVATSVAIQGDGKIVVEGYGSNGANYDVTLQRYDVNGSLDLTFDTDGMVTTAIGTSGDRAFSAAIQSDGKILAAGYSTVGSTLDIAVLRFNTNGSLDNSFDGDGIVTTPIGQSDEGATFVTLQNDGKIVVGGFSRSGADYDFAVLRYNNPSINTDVNESTEQEMRYSVFPNPFSASTTILLGRPCVNATIAVYNALCEQVMELNNISGYSIILHRNDLPGGVYYVQLTEGNLTSLEKIIVSNVE